MELRAYLSLEVALLATYVIVWYTTYVNWVPSFILTPLGEVLLFLGIILTAIFVVEVIRES